MDETEGRSSVWTMQQALEVMKDGRLPDVSSACEHCPLQFDCQLAKIEHYQISACSIRLPDDLAHALRVTLEQRIRGS